jgi:hypothetical protein
MKSLSESHDGSVQMIDNCPRPSARRLRGLAANYLAFIKLAAIHSLLLTRL